MKDMSAFPYVYKSGSSKEGFTCHVIPGMDLRDYFAGQALTRLAGMVSGIDYEYEVIARKCYETADQMLIEREKGENNG